MAQPTKVFVGSLPPGTKPEELRRLFENYGVVVECDVMNRCGFVHMKNAAMAESAIVALHESDFKGQNIVVEHGRPKERKQGGGGPRGGGRGGGNRGMMVGFPGKQNSNKFNQAATLQLAGVIMGLLGDQQNQPDEISGGNNMRGDTGFRRGGGGPQGGRGVNFQGNRGGNQNMNGIGPMRNQGFKGDRSAPYPQGMNNANQGGGGRFNNQPNRGGGAGVSGGNFNSNPRGGNFAPKHAGNNFAGGSNWNSQRGGAPQQTGQNFAEDNFSGGFSGNMGNSSAGNFGGQQDRRGFALPSNQFQQYGGGFSGNDGSFGGDDGASFADDGIYQRRTNNPANAPVIIDFRSAPGGGNMGGAGNFNRGGKSGGRGGGGGGQGGFTNRGGQGFQQGGGFKRGGNNMNSGDNYQQNFPPLGGSEFGGQGGFGGNNRNRGGQGGRGGGNVMNRNAPRQNMPNRRY